MKIAAGVEAMNMPDRPPMTNMATKERAFNIGVVNRMLPPQRVPSQLNVLIADGTAMTIVEIMKVVPSSGFMPLWNMWWPQTMKPRPAIPLIEYDIARYPNTGLRENTSRPPNAMPRA